MEHILDIDRQLFIFINSLSGNQLLDGVMLLVSSQELWIALSILWMFYLAAKKKAKAIRPILGLSIAMGVTDALAFQVLKPSIARLRPCYALENVSLVQDRCGGDFGFPSNHAANGGATIAFVALFRNRKILALSLLIVTLVSFSRIYLGVHYPLDVVGGTAFGFVVSSTILRFIFRNRKDLLS